jgi:hypothetical protein
MVPESFTDPYAGYLDHPFLKTRHKKKTTRRSENGSVDRCAGYVRRVTHDEIADAVS